jgi:hypothetical protein
VYRSIAIDFPSKRRQHLDANREDNPMKIPPLSCGPGAFGPPFATLACAEQLQVYNFFR